MLSRSVGVVATCCALGANAFLLPPGIAPGPGHRTSINPFVSVDPKNQVLELPCSSCAFSAEKTEESVAEADDSFSIQGGANNLILYFTVSEDGQELNLNDVPIYPVQAGFDALGAEKAHSWIVNQLPASSSIEELEIGENKGVPLRISGAGTKMSKTKIISANGDEIIPLEFQILSLNDQPMTIDEIAIQLLRDENGELLILSVEPAHENMMDHLPMSFGPPPPPHPHFHPDGPEGPEGHRPDGHHPKECGSLPAPLCRFLHTVDEKFEEAKNSRIGKFAGCGGPKSGPPHEMPGHIRPHFGAPDADGNRKLESGMPPHMRPHGPPGPGHRGPHGHHGPHGPHHRHALAHAFFKGVVAILIPVMAGVFVGLTVSIVGLLIGKLIGWFWVKFVRGGKRGYASVALDEEAADAEADNGKTDHEHMEAPPVYEDAPAYELSNEKEEK
jgi:hypothetical protein